MDQYLFSSVAICTQCQNHPGLVFISRISYDREDKKEPHSWGNKLNADLIKFYFSVELQ